MLTPILLALFALLCFSPAAVSAAPAYEWGLMRQYEPDGVYDSWQLRVAAYHPLSPILETGPLLGVGTGPFVAPLLARIPERKGQRYEGTDRKIAEVCLAFRSRSSMRIAPHISLRAGFRFTHRDPIYRRIGLGTNNFTRNAIWGWGMGLALPPIRSWRSILAIEAGVGVASWLTLGILLTYR